VQIVGYINTNKDHLHGQNEILCTTLNHAPIPPHFVTEDPTNLMHSFSIQYMAPFLSDQSNFYHNL